MATTIKRYNMSSCPRCEGTGCNTSHFNDGQLRTIKCSWCAGLGKVPTGVTALRNKTPTLADGRPIDIGPVPNPAELDYIPGVHGPFLDIEDWYSDPESAPALSRRGRAKQ